MADQSHHQVKKDIDSHEDPKQAELLQKYFQTGPGQYAEGDKFAGVKVPIQRQIAKKYTNLSLASLQKLLHSKTHEHRLVALLILTYKFPSLNTKEQQAAIDFYLENSRKNINNWDLVDLSAPKILGKYLLKNDKKQRKILEKLAKSKNMWRRRIAILATLPLIKNGESYYTLKIAKQLRYDDQPLIHKATGWMLRELWKVNPSAAEKFLNTYAHEMPREMLRYAIEKMPEKQRQKYLKTAKLDTQCQPSQKTKRPTTTTKSSKSTKQASSSTETKSNQSGETRPTSKEDSSTSKTPKPSSMKSTSPDTPTPPAEPQIQPEKED